jgi:sec-independent protein translocase protein TatA
MPFGLQGWHLVVILAIILLLFGAPKLPALTRSVAQSMRIFRSELRHNDDEAPADKAEAASTETTSK